MPEVTTADHEPKHPGNPYCCIKNEFDISCAFKVLLTERLLWSVCSVLFTRKAQMILLEV